MYPTHGFGSFCSATPTSGTASTIGQSGRMAGRTVVHVDDNWDMAAQVGVPLAS